MEQDTVDSLPIAPSRSWWKLLLGALLTCTSFWLSYGLSGSIIGLLFILADGGSFLLPGMSLVGGAIFLIIHALIVIGTGVVGIRIFYRGLVGKPSTTIGTRSLAEGLALVLAFLFSIPYKYIFGFAISHFDQLFFLGAGISSLGPRVVTFFAATTSNYYILVNQALSVRKKILCIVATSVLFFVLLPIAPAVIFYIIDSRQSVNEYTYSEYAPTEVTEKTQEELAWEEEYAAYTVENERIRQELTTRFMGDTEEFELFSPTQETPPINEGDGTLTYEAYFIRKNQTDTTRVEKVFLREGISNPKAALFYGNPELRSWLKQPSLEERGLGKSYETVIGNNVLLINELYDSQSAGMTQVQWVSGDYFISMERQGIIEVASDTLVLGMLEKYPSTW